ADHTVYNSRTKTQTQADLGNFSRSDFTHVTPVNKRLSYTSKEIFRSAGVYALPGQTFSVTRNDSSDLTVAIFINTLRSSSTKEFEANKYNRPKFLQSVAIPIAPGETISLTSPYGGPVQLMFSANDLQVELDFTHIGLHPHWSSAADNAGFSAAMLAGNYDWAEVVTPNFEIHSQLEKMRTTLARDNVSNVEDLAAITEQYIHNYPHVLAGYQGPGINVVAEIHDFSRDKGWAIENLDIVKHMNADQATCGWGCSGNPYDAGWSFNPVGHGDIHEFGHGLEKRELRFSGWETHSTTNTYVYYSQTQYAKETGIVECKSLPFDSLFETLKASIKETDPEAYMRAQSLNSWDQSVAMTIQMMMAAQAEGSLIDGWHLLARLHILLREFKRAVHSEILWLNKRDSLGFGQYSRAAAKALDKNDWLVIAISAATELDYREFLAMWGLSFSDTAATQVANLGFSAVTKKFYQVKDGGYCEGLDKAAITIIDTDGDGYLDFDDAFPDDATEHADVDADGIGDNVDTEYNPDASQLNYRDVHIKSLINNKCLGFITDSATIGAQAMALDCNSASEQKWSWDKQGRLHSGSSPEYCLAASSHKRGGKLRLAQCDDRENQQWIMNEADQTIQALNQKNAYFVQNRAAEVNLWSFHGERNQQWMIVPW
ncbi:MAG: RICIN domain-containing protein, partial [Psychrobium sp.]|nr:RICIN domain-containing protein [Psychrobium sp.]